MILGVCSNTANEAVLGDLGWWELKARRDKARLKLLKTFADMKNGEYAKTLCFDNNSVWRGYTDNVLRALKMGQSDYLQTTKSEWRNKVTAKTHEREEEFWIKGMESKTKLRTYMKVKKKLRLEPYLEFKAGWPV